MGKNPPIGSQLIAPRVIPRPAKGWDDPEVMHAHRLQQIMSQKKTEVVKDYYLIFKEGSPPAITESWKAAEHWQRLGCTIETYQRIITEKSNASHDSCGTCCNHR